MSESTLFKRLQSEAEKWRSEGWPCEEPFIGEILRWQFAGDPADNVLKFLRWPQFRALEVYWMLRFKFGTPHILNLYRTIYADDTVGFGSALGLSLPPAALKLLDVQDIEDRIRKDEEFMQEYGSDQLREALSLQYPSYIFALTMGAGKTILISAIIATEFAMALRQSEGDSRFMRNALVFAPGKTILGSLREISAAPYADILPPESCRQFNASAKIIYPRDDDPEIHVAPDGAYNIIITNTEKIRLQANTGRRRRSHQVFDVKEERDQLEANLRLHRITSLPNLGVFSDEAHHTYGNITDKIKRVRQTVDHIAAETSLIAVINTTGTPYHKRSKPLVEVVSWYGIKQGIEDNILKRFRVTEYNMARDTDENVRLAKIIQHFFEEYRDVVLPNGARSKIAFFFKQTEHLDECKEVIANEMEKIGEDVSQILVNTQNSGRAEKEEFAALNDPASRKRVILLVGIGTEGWDCPSLFATALIKGKTTGTFTLQASTRCLRQVQGNNSEAHMYLDSENAKTLNREMLNAFDMALAGLAGLQTLSKSVTLRIRKTDELPKLKIVYERKKIVRALPPESKIDLTRPKIEDAPEIKAIPLAPSMSSNNFILTQTGESIIFHGRMETTTPHAAATQLAANYHLPVSPLLEQLRELYPEGEIAIGELRDLTRQVEAQTARYEESVDLVTEAMALIRVEDNANRPVFQQDEEGQYFHTLRYTEPVYKKMERAGLFVEVEDDNHASDFRSIKDKEDVSFHYTPYNFDSAPERDFFEKILTNLGLNVNDIQCFLFTGGLTGVNQTDFFFEYKGVDGRFHRYHPDFVIVRNDEKFLIVEVKSEAERGSETVKAKEKAVKRLTGIQPDKIEYHVIYSADAAVSRNELDHIFNWINQ